MASHHYIKEAISYPLDGIIKEKPKKEQHFNGLLSRQARATSSPISYFKV